MCVELRKTCLSNWAVCVCVSAVREGGGRWVLVIKFKGIWKLLPIQVVEMENDPTIEIVPRFEIL